MRPSQGDSGRFRFRRHNDVGNAGRGDEGDIEGADYAKLNPQNFSALITLTARKAAVIVRPDRLIVVDSKASVDWRKNTLRTAATVVADRAVTELPRDDTPRHKSRSGASAVPNRAFRASSATCCVELRR